MKKYLLSSVLLFACVGDAPVQTAPDDAGTAPDTSVADTSMAKDTSTPMDSAVVCNGTTVNCGGTCVDIASDGANCGKCGHDCGGGLCGMGVCQPMVVVDAQTHPVFDIDATNVYFSNADKVLSCPLTGCKLTPTQVGVTGSWVDQADQGGMMMVSGGTVAFMADALGSNTSGPFVYTCPTTGCPSTLNQMACSCHQGFWGMWGSGGTDFYWGFYKSIYHSSCSAPGVCGAGAIMVNEGYSGGAPVAVDTNGIYFVQAQTMTTLQSCPRTGPCTPSTIGTVSVAPSVATLGVYNNTLYAVGSGGSGYTNGKITTCSTSATGCTGTLFIDKQGLPTDLAVDSTGVYWHLVESSTPDSIVTCPLAGTPCTGGPRTLAANQGGMYGLKTDANFVYWATATQILRVAK